MVNKIVAKRKNIGVGAREEITYPVDFIRIKKPANHLQSHVPLLPSFFLVCSPDRVSYHDLPANIMVGEALQEWTHRERYLVSKDQGCITKGKWEPLGEKNCFTGMYIGWHLHHALWNALVTCTCKCLLTNTFTSTWSWLGCRLYMKLKQYLT